MFAMSPGVCPPRLPPTHHGSLVQMAPLGDRVLIRPKENDQVDVCWMWCLDCG